MEKKKLIKFYRDKIKEINHHNFLYYEKSEPELSDSSFDNLKKEILDLEKKIQIFKK